MRSIKIAILITIWSIFPVVSVTNSNLGSNDSRLGNRVKAMKNITMCRESSFLNSECAEIFKAVAIINTAAKNRSMIPRNGPSYITSAKYLIMDKDFYSPKEYCIVNAINESTVEVEVCKRNCSKTSVMRPCIPKCCPWGESVRVDMKTGEGLCVPSNEPTYSWKPDIYNHIDYLQVLKREDYQMGFSPHYYNPARNIEDHCKSVWIWHGETRFSFHMLQNGLVRWRYQTNKWFKVRPAKNYDNFCLEEQENSTEQILHICFSDLVKSSSKFRIPYASLAFISSTFMFLLLMMYGLLWKEQNSHGWIQFLFFLSLFFFYLLEGIGFLMIQEDLHIKPICYLTSVTHHFFLTLTTTSLLTLSSEIFWTFLKMHPNEGKRKDLRRFYICATISCSSAVIFVLAGVLMNVVGSPYGPPYGLLFCTGTHWVLGKFLQISFVVVSLLILLSTLVVIYKHKATTKILVSDSRTFYIDLGKVILKLIIVQGMTWTSLMIIQFLRNYKDRTLFKHIFQVIYNCQSVLLFFLFACDQRKLKSLEEKYPPFKALSDTLCYLCRRTIRQTDEDQPLVPSHIISNRKNTEGEAIVN